MSAEASPSVALKRAVCAGDAAAVEGVLTRHPELTSRLDEALPDDGFGATPLLTAVYRDDRDVVDALLRAGANINARSDWWAGGFGVLDHDGKLTDYLIERGATIDAFAAARLGRIDRLEELLAADPGVVHARGGDGQTPLHFAHSIAVAEFLLERGADIDARDVDHESTPVQWMVRDRQDVARYLVARGCRTDILMAAALGDLELIRTHIEADSAAVGTTVGDEYFPRRNPRSAGTIYNWTLGTGKTAHIVAREFGHDAIFRLLMARTPDTLKLAIFCEIGDEAAAQSLLRGNPSLPQTLTPVEIRKLPDAARDENLQAVRLMLDAGWPIDARGQHGATALHWAGFHGHAAIAIELLRHAPPLEVKDADFNGTPLSWAVYGSVHGWRCKTGDYGGTVELLLNAGAKTPPLSDEVPESVRAVFARRGFSPPSASTT
jgi:ankyrin repeat protein